MAVLQRPQADAEVDTAPEKTKKKQYRWEKYGLSNHIPEMHHNHTANRCRRRWFVVPLTRCIHGTFERSVHRWLCALIQKFAAYIRPFEYFNGVICIPIYVSPIIINECTCFPITHRTVEDYLSGNIHRDIDFIFLSAEGTECTESQ